MNVTRLQALRRSQKYHLLPVKTGMMIEIHEKIGEGNNQRIWKFKGLIIKVQRPEHADGTFVMRGKTSGHTIEKIYPLSFPNFEHVYLLDLYKVRRAKMYYIREKIGKDAKMKSLITSEQRDMDLLAIAKKEFPTTTVADSMVVEEKNATPAEEEITPEVADEIIAETEQTNTVAEPEQTTAEEISTPEETTVESEAVAAEETTVEPQASTSEETTVEPQASTSEETPIEPEASTPEETEKTQ